MKDSTAYILGALAGLVPGVGEGAARAMSMKDLWDQRALEQERYNQEMAHRAGRESVQDMFQQQGVDLQKAQMTQSGEQFTQSLAQRGKEHTENLRERRHEFRKTQEQEKTFHKDAVAHQNALLALQGDRNAIEWTLGRKRLKLIEEANDDLSRYRKKEADRSWTRSMIEAGILWNNDLRTQADFERRNDAVTGLAFMTYPGEDKQSEDARAAIGKMPYDLALSLYRQQNSQNFDIGKAITNWQKHDTAAQVLLASEKEDERRLGELQQKQADAEKNALLAFTGVSSLPKDEKEIVKINEALNDRSKLSAAGYAADLLHQDTTPASGMIKNLFDELGAPSWAGVASRELMNAAPNPFAYMSTAPLRIAGHALTNYFDQGKEAMDSNAANKDKVMIDLANAIAPPEPGQH